MMDLGATAFAVLVRIVALLQKKKRTRDTEIFSRYVILFHIKLD